jgi:ubiquinone/menaquinone biosynthesis C-methylase UbiE
MNIKKIIGKWMERITVKNLNTEITKHVKGKKILDNGCGNGSFIYEMHKDKEIYGIDINRRDVLKRGAKEFRIVDSTKLPYKNNFFDCVVFAGVIQYIRNYQKSVDEIRRVLKPGGRIIIAAVNKRSFFRRIRLINPIPKKDAGEYQYFTFKELSEYLSKNEFSIAKEIGIDFIKIPKNLCSNILIIAIRQ